MFLQNRCTEPLDVKLLQKTLSGLLGWHLAALLRHELLKSHLQLAGHLLLELGHKLEALGWLEG